MQIASKTIIHIYIFYAGAPLGCTLSAGEDLGLFSNRENLSFYIKLRNLLTKKMQKKIQKTEKIWSQGKIGDRMKIILKIKKFQQKLKDRRKKTLTKKAKKAKNIRILPELKRKMEKGQKKNPFVPPPHRQPPRLKRSDCGDHSANVSHPPPEPLPSDGSSQSHKHLQHHGLRDRQVLALPGRC